MRVFDSRLRTAFALAGVIAGIVGYAGGQSAAAISPSAPPQATSVAARVPNLYEAASMLARPITSISSSMAMRLCSISSIMGSSAWPLRTRNSASFRSLFSCLSIVW